MRLPGRMLWGLVMEGVETTRMVRVFARHGRRKMKLIPAHRNPTPEEMQAAYEQLKDIPRFLPFFIIVVVPVPGVTEGYALAAMTLERWLGDRFTLLPSRFRHIFQPEQPASPAPDAHQAAGKKPEESSDTERV